MPVILSVSEESYAQRTAFVVQDDTQANWNVYFGRLTVVTGFSASLIVWTLSQR